MDGVDLEIAAGERRAILGPNGAGKTTLFNVIAGEFPPTSGTIELFGPDVTETPARLRARLGLARTYQQSRVFGGLSVEDNIYLAVLGVRTGHVFPLRSAKRDEPLRAEARAAAEEVGSRPPPGRARGRALARRASSAGDRHGAGGPAPVDDARRASGRTVARRARSADRTVAGAAPNVTLLLIEHDMDVALRVADWVTMMHDGRVVAEGTPAEIRANETVHELYLGSRYYDE